MLLNSLPIYTYDASLEYKSAVEIQVDEKVASLLKKPYKLEILVENMGRTNIGWEMNKLRKGQLTSYISVRGSANFPTVFSYNKYFFFTVM